MRYRTPLDGLLFSSTSLRVLRVLIQARDHGRTGREMARMAGTPPHRTSQVLARFEGEGLVQSRVVGRAHLWTLGDRHPLVPALRALFEAEARETARRKARLRRALGGVAGVRRAIVFGSAARGREHSESDLDLLVVASNREALNRVQEKLAALRFDLLHEGGMRISPLLYTEREFDRKRGLPVIQVAEAEGEVLVG
ncbi:MAG TPA: nucleotidyltransferase domain-containing protein [Candidatus Thermoplasmatota archaeon]